MSRRRTRAPTRRRRVPTWVIVVGVAVLVLVVAVFALRFTDRPAGSPFTPVDGFQHVHGLAVHPEDPSILYVATHHGLIRGIDGRDWMRIGDIRDYMGFSLHPTNGDVMWASGHPRSFSGEPNPLGVIHSTDGGITWDRIGLPGVDLHAMAVSRADADRLWGYGGGALYASSDGGHTWSEHPPPPEPVLAFGPHPTEPDTVYAGTPTRILKSTDGGSTWSAVADTRADDVEVHPTDPAILYAAGDGGARKSTDGGTTWTTLPLDEPTGHLAINPSDPDVVYATMHDAALHRSTDGGATWTRIKGAG